MPKRMGKCEVHRQGDRMAESLMCNVGVKNAKKLAHRMWRYLRDEDKRQTERNKNESKNGI